jgi:hypothetical protein
VSLVRRGRTIAGIVTLGIVAAAGCVPSFDFDHELVLTTRVDDRQSPLNVRDSFSFEDERIFVFLRVRDTRGPPHGAYHFEFFDGDGSIVGSFGREFAPLGAAWQVAMPYRLNPEIDEPGRWRVDVFIEGRHVDTLRFPVTRTPLPPAQGAVDHLRRWLLIR